MPTPHGLAFAPIKVGVLIDIDMGTILMPGKWRVSARSDGDARRAGHAGVMRQPEFDARDALAATSLIT
jgi:hypothetical protein